MVLITSVLKTFNKLVFYLLNVIYIWIFHTRERLVLTFNEKHIYRRLIKCYIPLSEIIILQSQIINKIKISTFFVFTLANYIFPVFSTQWWTDTFHTCKGYEINVWLEITVDKTWIWSLFDNTSIVFNKSSFVVV